MAAIFSKAARKALIGGITLYRYLVRPYLPLSCRFTPSCSEYAVQSIRRWGAIRGAWLAVKRLARCHPLCPGGFDPIP